MSRLRTETVGAATGLLTKGPRSTKLPNLDLIDKMADYFLPEFRTFDRPRVFQIGFNRCGTTSLAALFHWSGYRVGDWEGGEIAASIELAKQEGKQMLHYVPGYDVYADMECVTPLGSDDVDGDEEIGEKVVKISRRCAPIYSFKDFKLLDAHYPGSRFILNLRNIEDWVESRLRFLDDGYRWCIHGENVHSDQATLIDCWTTEWKRHVRDVNSYFADRDEDLLVFNIDTDSGVKLYEFFKDTDWPIDASVWTRRNLSRRVECGRGNGEPSKMPTKPPLWRRGIAAIQRGARSLGISSR